MDMSSTINRHFQQTKDQFYQNSGYCDSRIDKQLLIIDTLHKGGGGVYEQWPTTGTTFSCDLVEPLKIDTLCDVYLDNFTTYNVDNHNKADGDTAADSNSQLIVIGIDQFNIKSNSNNPNLFNKIVIPNESSTVHTTDNLQVHKARKMNYICSINPQTLTKISGTITGSNNTHITTEVSFRFIAEFVIVARN